jgi:hypothetical protein
VPYARGGEASVENLSLVCRAHNALIAERDYGPELMRSKRQQVPERVASVEAGGDSGILVAANADKN